MSDGAVLGPGAWRAFLSLILLALLASCGQERLREDQRAELARIRAAMEAVKPLHRPVGPQIMGDWLTVYPEKGQTFDEYLGSRPTLPEGRRRVLYVVPLGNLTPAQRQIVDITADYLQQFFALEARVGPVLPTWNVPASARRFNAVTDSEQIETHYLLSKILKPALPPDAVASIGLTASDLYPDKKMNFVFGQASLSERVGVWSFYHFGDPDQDANELRACLIRTLKTASHETGHMFSIHHCTKYQCVMNGSNSLYELDGHPLAACPECMAKICWAAGCDPRERYEKLARFFARHGLNAEGEPFEKALRRLDPAVAP